MDDLDKRVEEIRKKIENAELPGHATYEMIVHDLLAAYDLLRSVDEEPDEGWDAAWLAEVRRRSDELRTGRAQAVPLDEVKRRAEELLAEKISEYLLTDEFDPGHEGLKAAYDAMKRAYLRAMQCPHIEAVSKGEHSCSCIDDLVEK